MTEELKPRWTSYVLGLGAMAVLAILFLIIIIPCVVLYYVWALVGVPMQNFLYEKMDPHLAWFSIPKDREGYHIEVYGLCWGIFPGWHIARWNVEERQWYHHSTCTVNHVVWWRYKERKQADDTFVFEELEPGKETGERTDRVASEGDELEGLEGRRPGPRSDQSVGDWT